MRAALASGSRLPLVTLPDDAVLLAPPPPVDPIADVGAAVAEALRYPLAGPTSAIGSSGGGGASRTASSGRVTRGSREPDASGARTSAILGTGRPAAACPQAIARKRR